MARITCLVCLAITVSCCPKNALGRPSASSGHITKLEQSTFVLISVVPHHNVVYQHICLQLKRSVFKNIRKTVVRNFVNVITVSFFLLSMSFSIGCAKNIFGNLALKRDR
jgi:hypothetical protein